VLYTFPGTGIAFPEETVPEFATGKMKKNFADHICSYIKKILLPAILWWVAGTSLFAQDSWNLQRCVDHALKNNIDLTLKNNQVQTQSITLKESKAALLPDLNMSSSVNMNFGRNIDPKTNAITFNQTMSNGYWIGTSMDIFRGMVKRNRVVFNKYLLLAGKEEALDYRNKLIFRVMTTYYTVLFSAGLVEVAKKQAALSEGQMKRMQKLVEVGRESPLTVQEMRSQWAADKLAVVKAQNALTRTLLEMKQLLRLGAQQTFAVDTGTASLLPPFSLPDVDSVYHAALTQLPEIRQKEYLCQASQKELAMAKGARSPRIYLSAGYGTNYFSGAGMAFSSQIINNQNQYVVMGINIPIFNNGTIRNTIKRKSIDLDNRELELQKQQEILYSEIWNAVSELEAAKNEYLSSKESCKLSELTLRNTSVKLGKGLASTTDYEVAKQKYVSARATMLKTKLIYIMRGQMLQFYMTGRWDHLLNNNNNTTTSWTGL
jgi:outer membrane protein